MEPKAAASHKKVLLRIFQQVPNSDPAVQALEQGRPTTTPEHLDFGGAKGVELREKLREAAETWLAEMDAEAVARGDAREKKGWGRGAQNVLGLGDERERGNRQLGQDGRGEGEWEGFETFEESEGCTLLARLARLRKERASKGGPSRLANLMRAAARGDVREIDVLRHSVDTRDKRGWTALHYAALFQQPLAVRALLESGANPQVEAPGDLGAGAVPEVEGEEEESDVSVDADDADTYYPKALTPGLLASMVDTSNATEVAASARVRHLLRTIMPRAPMAPRPDTLAGIDGDGDASDDEMEEVTVTGLNGTTTTVRPPPLFASDRGQAAAFHPSIIPRHNMLLLGKGALRRHVFDRFHASSGLGGYKVAKAVHTKEDDDA